MRVKIFAFALMIFLIVAVSINTYTIDKEILDISEKVDSLDIEEDSIDVPLKETKQIYELFKRRELFFSLTVNHDDLTSIDDSFAELIGNLEVSSWEDATVTKNRLLCSLEHLRRLSGINLDAII